MQYRERTSGFVIGIMFICIFLITACGKAVSHREENVIRQENDELVICSVMKEEQIMPIVKEFSELNGYRVKVIYRSEEELEKLLVEKDEDMLSCDMIFGAGADTYDKLQSYLIPYESSQEEYLNPSYRVNNHIWTPFSVQPLVMIYNTNLITEREIPKGWMCLLEPERSGKIAFLNPQKESGDLLTIITASASDKHEYIQLLYDNVQHNLKDSFRQIDESVSEGRCAIGITLEADAVKLQEKEENIKFLYPQEGTALFLNGSALLKDAGNIELAQEFIDFTINKDVQKLLALEMKYRSVRQDVGSLADIKPLDKIILIESNAETVKKEREELLTIWKEIAANDEVDTEPIF